MSRKRWCLLVASMLAFAVAAIITLVAIVDPFEIYHRALFYQPAYASDTQMYANAGVAKSYDYDSIIIGTSVTENCRPSVYDEMLGGRFVKLCMNGGTARDHAKMMEIAFRTHDVKHVVYGLDLFAFSQYHTNQKAATPDYLYDENPFNDVSYIFNKSVLLSYIPKALARMGTKPDDSARDSMYFWNPPQMPSEEELFALVDFSSPIPEQQPADKLEFYTGSNAEYNLLSYIRCNSDTVFSIFFPPYSLLYWAQQARDGMLDARMAQRSQLAQLLLAEPNVNLYDFAAHDEWTQNYNLYFDVIHYISAVNDEIASYLAEGRFRVQDMAQLHSNNHAIHSACAALFPSH